MSSLFRTLARSAAVSRITIATPSAVSAGAPSAVAAAISGATATTRSITGARHFSFAHNASLNNTFRSSTSSVPGAPLGISSFSSKFNPNVINTPSALIRSLGSPQNKTQRRFNSLQPKKMKYRKKHKGKIPIPIGGSTKGTYVEFGDYGLRIKDGVRLTAKQIQAAHTTIRRKLKTVKGSQIWTRVFPDIPVTSKGGESRMGKGKGSVDFYATRVGINRIIFEVGGAGLRIEHAKEAMRLASAKLPVPVEFVVKADQVKPVKATRLAPGFETAAAVAALRKAAIEAATVRPTPAPPVVATTAPVVTSEAAASI